MPSKYSDGIINFYFLKLEATPLISENTVAAFNTYENNIFPGQITVGVIRKRPFPDQQQVSGESELAGAQLFTPSHPELLETG